MKYFFIDDKLNQVCDILNKHPAGLPKMQIAKKIGLSMSRTSNFTVMLRQSGRIQYIGGVKYGRWVLARHLQYALAQIDGERGPELIRKAAARAASREAIKNLHYSWAEKPPMQIRVNAASAPSIPKRGPASVWELAT